MTFKPAHKHVGDGGRPGQLVSSPLAPETPRDERFLSEYIARKADDFDYFKPYQQEVKKFTFEEWFADVCGNDTYTQQEDIKSRMEWAWEAALTRGKL